MTVLPLLKPRPRALLDFVRAYAIEHGYAPSLADCRDGIGLASISTVVYHLRELERSGWVSRAPGRRRALAVLNPVDGSES